MKRKHIVKPQMATLGLLGFLGFLSIALNEPTFLVFFSFFGYFSYYWESKFANEIPDERLNENRRKAQQIALKAGTFVIFAGMILIGNLFGSKDPAKAYAILVALISLAFAAAINLSAYLTYRFDKGE